MSVKPRARSSASSGSSNSRSVTRSRKSPTASASIRLLSLALHQVVQLLLLFGRDVLERFLDHRRLVWMDNEDTPVFPVLIKVEFHLLDHLEEAVEERTALRVDHIARRLGDATQVLVE